MRKIKAGEIIEKVRLLALEANFKLRPDILKALEHAYLRERKPCARGTIKILLKNALQAEKDCIPICQDTGMVEVFCKIGRDVRLLCDITECINKGICLAYTRGYLRKSIVSDPLIRKNTGTNTPCVIHYDIIKGDHIHITVVPKGFGSENASRLKMFKPADTKNDIIDFVLDTVKQNGPSACPPLVIGIGIGGTLDKAAMLATEAILIPVNRKNPKKHLSLLEDIILKKINSTGIGPAGLGGGITCLGVNILDFATHIAGLPVCVKISCHATRSAKGVL
jgi:fumarate hydratase subunit alpha